MSNPNDTIWPLHTPVKHKSLGFVGWIHATTTMKEIFTGDTSGKWQYTIRVENETQLRAAPPADLEWIQTQAPFPAYLTYQGSVTEKNYLQETRLHALGYQISGLNSEERFDIIKFVAIPMLGAKEVVRTINAVVSSRIAKPVNADKFRHAITGWNTDLNAIAKHCEGTEEAASVHSSIAYIQRKLLELKLINPQDVFSS